MPLRFKSLISLAALSIAAVAHADPLDPGQLPADTQWAIHVDVDSLRKTGVWKTLDDRLESNPAISDKIGQVETLFNARFPDDLHDVTISGSAFGDKTGAVVVHATVDRKQVETMLAGNNTFASEPHGDHSLLSWTDHGENNFGCFINDSLFIIGPNKDRVAALIDTLEKKSESMKPDADLVQGQQPGVMVYVAGQELAKLRQVQAAKSPLLTQMKSAWIAMTEEKDDVVVRLHVTAMDAAHAEMMRKAALGIQAGLSLASGEPDAKPSIQTLAELAGQATVAAKDNNVVVELRVPEKNIPDLIDKAIAAKGGGR